MSDIVKQVKNVLGMTETAPGVSKEQPAELTAIKDTKGEEGTDEDA